jgi:glycosyltransferase involved in cell wall biosynthesis
MESTQPFSYCLFIGRIKKYKGLNTLIKAWEELDQSQIKLLIAGEGRIPKKAKKQKNILTVNKWLNNNEIHQLVANASFLVLPYIEASQSGILKIAAAYNVPCLVTPVGALPDYSRFGHPCIISKSTDRNSLLESLEKAIDGRWEYTKQKESPLSISEIMTTLLVENVEKRTLDC